MPRYDLIAVDLDGTLLDPASRVSPANVRAVHEARRAGADVMVCTGRGLVECRDALDAIEQADPVAVAGGSILACPSTSATLHRFPMRPDLVREAVGLVTTHGHAALVLKDRHAAGYDYLVVMEEGKSRLDEITRWWFERLKVEVHFVRTIDEDAHPEHTVRVGACATGGTTDGVARVLAERLNGRAVLHHFPAVVPSSTRGRAGGASGQTLIVEVFDAAVSKWTAIEHYARTRGIDPSRIAAIGDQINDVAMLRSAGLGVAMGNAVPEALAVADRVTLDNASDGVARAIEHILEGRW